MFPFRHTYHVNCEDCTGDDLEHCKGTRDCFKASDSEQCIYSMWVGSGYDSMDSDFLGFDRRELCYQTDGCNGLYDAIACEKTWQSSHVRYCTMCFSSSNLFGCVGLKEKDYCILNKQYSETEYSVLTEKLKVHMEETEEYGHYFPPYLSLFKKMSLPVPRSCPQCRYSDKFKRMNQNKLWHRQCMCEKTGHEHNGRCLVRFETSYAPDRSELVYCETCYQKEIV